MAQDQANRGGQATASWTIDAAHTSVEFAVKHMMFTTVRGRFTRLSGTVWIDAADPTRSHAEVDIDAGSLDTGVADRDNHLKSADFLDVEKHPDITFRSTRVEGAPKEPGDRFRLIGELTIRGKTMPVTLDAEFDGVGKDPWGGDRAGFSARGTLDRRDFGLMWNQALETGGILVGNEVKLDIDAQLVRQQAARRSAA